MSGGRYRAVDDPSGDACRVRTTTTNAEEPLL
jgi:hypothetical protein